LRPKSATSPDPGGPGRTLSDASSPDSGDPNDRSGRRRSSAYRNVEAGIGNVARLMSHTGHISMATDINDIYPFNSPMLFYRSLDIIVLMQSFYASYYMSDWAATLGSVEPFQENPWVWHLLAVMPVIVLIPLIAQIVTMSSMLLSVAHLEPEVIGRLCEETEDVMSVRDQVAKKLNNLFRQRSLNFVAAHKIIFHEYDDDESGELDAMELRDALRGLGIFLKTEQFSRFWRVLDLNKDGVVSEEEFCEFFENTDHTLDSAGNGGALMSMRDTDAPPLEEESSMRGKATASWRKEVKSPGGPGASSSRIMGKTPLGTLESSP